VKQAVEIDSRINALSQAASQIGDVIKLIISVTEQNNIEVAGAGEATAASPWSRRRSTRSPTAVPHRSKDNGMIRRWRTWRAPMAKTCSGSSHRFARSVSGSAGALGAPSQLRRS